jgi:acyl-homoserine-lactone acylase
MNHGFKRGCSAAHVVRLALWGACVGLTACGGGNDSATTTLSADIRTTQYGVPHIKADSFAGAGYGAGYAYARDNFCLLADQLVTVNGERAKFFGPDAQTVVSFKQVKNLNSDFFFKSYLDDAALKAGHEQAPTEVRDLLRGYVAGVNRYLRDTGVAALPDACKNQAWVRPITEADVYRMIAEKAIQASGGNFLDAIVAAQPPAVSAPNGVSEQKVARRAAQQQLRRQLAMLDGELLKRQMLVSDKPFGSNAYGLGAQATGTGTGMLLGNPHFPWSTTNRFYQLHLTVPGQYDVQGVSLAGLPMVVIGFNSDVAWSHTVSTSLRFTPYELTLVPGDPTSYLYEGQAVKMTSKTVSVDSKQADGSTKSVSRTLYFTRFGAVIQAPALGFNWSAQQAFALRDANLANTRLMEQWLRMGQAKSTSEVKAVLEGVTGLPWVNTIAADRAGQALYADIGSTPNVPPSKLGACTQSPTAQAILKASGIPVLDGSKAACEWTVDATARQSGNFAGSSMPSLVRGDFVANSNDSYWLSNPAQPLSGFSPVIGSVGTPRSLRTRLALLQIQQRLDGTDGLAGKGFGNLGVLQDVLFQNRLLAAELVVAPLVASCEATPTVNVAGQSVDLTAACSVLKRWDKKSNLESVGAVLFREFWRAAQAVPNVWATPFNPQEPLSTPRDLNTANSTVNTALLQTLGQTVQKLSALGIDINQPLGRYQFVVRKGVVIPVHGGDEFEGTFNKLTMAPLSAVGYPEVISGASYIQTVTWNSSGPVAEAMLSYGQSSDLNSPYNTDQTIALYGKKKFVRLPFTDAEIAADPALKVLRISE